VHAFHSIHTAAWREKESARDVCEPFCVGGKLIFFFSSSSCSKFVVLFFCTTGWMVLVMCGKILMFIRSDRVMITITTEISLSL
jgi:hypothetical protein